MYNLLDLVPKARLEKYLDRAASGLGVELRLLNLEGATLMARGRVHGAPGTESDDALDGVWENVRYVMGVGPKKLKCDGGYLLMSAPISYKELPLGFLSACRKDMDGGSEQALAMLLVSAGHIEALAESGIEVESLSAEVVKVYEELSLIYSITARLGAMVDIDDICRAVADEADNLLAPTDIMVQLVDETTGRLKTVYASGEHKKEAAGYSPRFDEGLIGHAFVNRRPVLVCEVEKDRRHVGWPFPLRRLLSVPILAEESILGVISVSDKRDGSEFNSREEKLFLAITSVAAISIKNSQLYNDIKGLLDGLISASVTAVESRDPTTSGHSQRVAVMTVELAMKVDASELPVFRGVKFSREQLQEMRYAALLHDFGKISVSERVLLKESKLYQPHLESIKGRFEYVKESLRRKADEKKLGILLGHGREQYASATAEIDAQLEEEVARLDGFMVLIEAVNDPLVMTARHAEMDRLKEVTATYYTGPGGDKLPLLTENEVRNLHILRGSLNEDERREIESHVTHSYNYLSKIPWTKNFQMLTEIVYAHHEKLDGTGYPRGLDSTSIPIQSKIMAVADIYDALTAWDRPYKKAVSTQKALFIMEAEAADGKLDPYLVQIFRDACIYKSVQGMSPRL